MQSLLKIMKIDAHGMLRCRPILLIVLKTGLCAHACYFLGHPKTLRIQVFWSPVGMGDGQIGCHKVSDMTAPRDYTNSELISERPSYFSLLLYRWQPVGDHRLFGPIWVRLFGCWYVVFLLIGLGFAAR
jgi:hypothetical protein